MKVIKESYEVSEELAKRLNSILADEFLASEAYRLAIVAMKGNKQHRLEEIAEKNGEDELEDHFKNLYEWMQSKGIRVVTDRDEMAQITNGSILKFTDGMSTKEIVDQLILSEEEAIDIYEDTIPHTELDLNTMLCGFLKDEREHLKELTDCLNEMGGGDKAESEVDEYHKSRQFNEKSVPYMILAELVKITAAGEKTIKVDEVPSYKMAFEMLQDYILEDPDMDDYVVEKYEDYMTGRDVHGKEKEIRLLEKNGEIGERSVSGFYEIVLRVAEQANPNERLGDYFLDDDYYAESRKR